MVLGGWPQTQSGCAHVSGITEMIMRDIIMLDFANSQALKSKQAKATTASNIIKNVIIADLGELYSPAEIEILQHAQQLIEDGRTRVQQLKEKRRGEEKRRQATEAKLYKEAYERALAALGDMTLAELYQLNVCFSFEFSVGIELIADYDHQYYLSALHSWLDDEAGSETFVDFTPEEAKEGWKAGIAEAAVEIIYWPCLKFHRDYQHPAGEYNPPSGIPRDFPAAIYSTICKKHQQHLSPSCLEVIRAIQDFEQSEEKVKLILSRLGQ